MLQVDRTGKYIGRSIEKVAIATIILQHAYQALSNVPDVNAVISTWDDDALYVLRKLLATKASLKYIFTYTI